MASAIHLKKSDWHVPAYRELAGLLFRGWSIETTLLYWNGFEEGASPPEGVNDLPVCHAYQSPVNSCMPPVSVWA